MTLRNEIMDFATVYRTLNPAKSGQDRYYDMLRKDQEKQDQIAADAVAAARKVRRTPTGAPTPLVPAATSTATPGLPTTPTQQVAMTTDYPPVTPTYDTTGVYKRGGKVQRFQKGGAAADPERSRRERGTSDDDFDTEDVRKLDQQQRPWKAQERNRQGDTFTDWAFAEPNTRRMKSMIDTNEARTDRENSAAGFWPGHPAPKFDDGGAVTEEDRQNEADLILSSLLQRDRDDAVRQTGEDFRPDPRAVFQQRARQQAADQQARYDAQEMRRTADQAFQPLPIRPSTAQRTPPDRGAPFTDIRRVNETGGEPLVERPAPTDVGVGDAVIPTAPAPASQSAGPPEPAPPAPTTDDYDPRTGMLRSQTDVPGAMTAGARPAPGATAAQAPAINTGPPPPRVATGDVDPDAVARPSAYPVFRNGIPTPKAPPPASNGPKGEGKGVNGPSGGSSGPGSGAGQVQAPPAPAAARAAVEDPRTRTAAFDPGRERINPDQTTAPRQLDQRGQVVLPTQQELAQMVATAAQPHLNEEGMSKALGTGAVSRPLVNELVQQYNPNGDLTEGQALLIGMHAKFKYLLSKGRAKEAATMAWGLIQAANMEAASLGMVARDQVRQGDVTGARQTLAHAANWAVDGVTHRAVGNGIQSIDANGKATFTPVDGSRALQMALGLADGSATWGLLHNAASLVMPKDNNAEGRQLRNELTRLQIEGAKQKLAKGAAGKSTGPSFGLSQLRNYIATGQVPAPPTSRGGGGDDSGWISGTAANAGDDRQESGDG